MLMDGDPDGLNITKLGKGACPWLNWALLQTKHGEKGRGQVLDAMQRLGTRARSCLACLRFVRNNQNAWQIDAVIKLIEDRR
jgi:hypothetical protein